MQGERSDTVLLKQQLHYNVAGSMCYVGSKFTGTEFVWGEKTKFVELGLQPDDLPTADSCPDTGDPRHRAGCPMWSPFPTKGSTNERPKLLLYELYNQLIATSGEKMEEKKRLGLDFTEHNRKYKQEESGFDLQMTKVRVQPSTFLSQRFSCKLFNCIKLCSVQCFFHYLVEIT